MTDTTPPRPIDDATWSALRAALGTPAAIDMCRAIVLSWHVSSLPATLDPAHELNVSLINRLAEETDTSTRDKLWTMVTGGEVLKLIGPAHNHLWVQQVVEHIRAGRISLSLDELVEGVTSKSPSDSSAHIFLARALSETLGQGTMGTPWHQAALHAIPQALRHILASPTLSAPDTKPWEDVCRTTLTPLLAAPTPNTIMQALAFVDGLHDALDVNDINTPDARRRFNGVLIRGLMALLRLESVDPWVHAQRDVIIERVCARQAGLSDPPHRGWENLLAELIELRSVHARLLGADVPNIVGAGAMSFVAERMLATAPEPVVHSMLKKSAPGVNNEINDLELTALRLQLWAALGGEPVMAEALTDALRGNKPMQAEQLARHISSDVVAQIYEQFMLGQLDTMPSVRAAWERSGISRHLSPTATASAPKKM